MVRQSTPTAAFRLQNHAHRGQPQPPSRCCQLAAVGVGTGHGSQCQMRST